MIQKNLTTWKQNDNRKKSYSEIMEQLIAEPDLAYKCNDMWSNMNMNFRFFSISGLLSWLKGMSEDQTLNQDIQLRSSN